jgi:capsular polysaccharide biosynthesis protein
MDQTIKDEEEIERLLGIPVLGVITRFDQAKK